jgi:hypothetical protein
MSSPAPPSSRSPVPVPALMSSSPSRRTGGRTGAAVDVVVAGVAVDLVVAEAAEQGVVADAAVDEVVVGAAVDLVVAAAAEDLVAAAHAEDAVVIGAAVDDLDELRPVRVGRRARIRADDQVVAARGRDARVDDVVLEADDVEVALAEDEERVAMIAPRSTIVVPTPKSALPKSPSMTTSWAAKITALEPGVDVVAGTQGHVDLIGEDDPAFHEDDVLVGRGGVDGGQADGRPRAR